MAMRAINLDTYSLSLLTAKEDILNPRSSTNWALFTYDGVSNKLKLADSGAGGLVELVGKFHVSKPQYGLCRVGPPGAPDAGGPRVVLISWMGPNLDELRKTECSSHVPAVRGFFREAHVFIRADRPEDVTEDKVVCEITKVQGGRDQQCMRRSSASVDKEETVGTNYRKTNAAMEMRRINRESFWARAEREEEERKEEERRRAAEERRRLERERVQKERKETEERDRKMNEKLQRIEEQRRKKAEEEEELHRKEKSRWEVQQREHSEEMRARLRRSESIEKAAEAAVLVSQRSINPREFFRQLSSSSLSPTSPGSPRTGKAPVRRYQRSLTDTAFIFTRSDPETSSSPRSPFSSRTSPSPFFHTTAGSPPTSPIFLPSPSLSQTPRGPQGPATSPLPSPSLSQNPWGPLRSTAPSQALPSLPPVGARAQETPVVSRSPPPTQPSAPPASPTLLASLEDPGDSESLAPAPLPPSPSPAAHPQALLETPVAPLPQSPSLNTELLSEVAYRVQAVLVEEEEEEEDEDEEHKEEVNKEEDHKAGRELPSSTSPIVMETMETAEPEEGEEEGAESTQETEPETIETSLEEPGDGQAENQSDHSQALAEPVSVELSEEGEEGAESTQETEAETIETSLEEPGDGQAEDQSDHSQAIAEPVSVELSEEGEESAVIDGEVIFQQIKEEAMIPTTNGVANGEEEEDLNGTERSVSPSDTDPSSPELTSYDLHGNMEENPEEPWNHGNMEENPEEPWNHGNMEENPEEPHISENGQQVVADRQMCVRALYDYQAEDESEISFEPGDIIVAVEAIDKAWWRGCSKDGRQGLFPSNYVETI